MKKSMECLMDRGGHENRRQRVNYFNWNYQVKEQTAFNANAKISTLSDERDVAIRERDRALAEKKAVLEARDTAIEQRDAAMAERDAAIRQRDNAIAALRFQERSAFNPSSSRGSKIKCKKNRHCVEECVLDVSPVSAIPFGALNAPHEMTAKKATKRQVTMHGTKAEWDENRRFSSADPIEFDKDTMPVPVCSCTGVPRRCYKWGNGGWQSSCCTTMLSLYPLPQMSNKRHSRVVGRKMSGGVFNRLLTRLVASGHDPSVPLDLKNYWAKHGTNRYVTIK